MKRSLKTEIPVILILGIVFFIVTYLLTSDAGTSFIRTAVFVFVAAVLRLSYMSYHNKNQ